jgi:hypothetical protein
MGQGHTAEGMSPGMFQELAGICDLYRQQSHNSVRKKNIDNYSSMVHVYRVALGQNVTIVDLILKATL